MPRRFSQSLSSPERYKPPFTLGPAIVPLVAMISELVGRRSAIDASASSLHLRRVNQIRSIQGSLAIEGNTLTQDQITAILDGKRVIAPFREIQEVRNAIKVYDKIQTWAFDSEADLLSAHGLMMAGLHDEIGRYRHGGVGILKGEAVIHLAPPAERVPVLMRDLFGWLGKTSDHPLIASSVFHYEFEFIHPFADGNGRMGRLWQSLILARWNPLFARLPVESLVFEHQAEYYEAINTSTAKADSAPFIQFMLSMILAALKDMVAPEVAPEVSPEVRKLVKCLKGEMSRLEIQRRLRLTDEKNVRLRYLLPALDAGLIERTIPEKPRSRLQKYRLTAKGRSALGNFV